MTVSLSNPNAGVPRQISLPDNDVPLVTDAGDADPLDTKANEDVRNMLKEEWMNEWTSECNMNEFANLVI